MWSEEGRRRRCHPKGQSSWKVTILCFVAIIHAVTGESQKPNIIVFLADDLGYGDLGCYGNATSRTQNIDSLARDGVKMTQHLTTASVCTPSRAAFLTGRYAIRSGMSPIGVQRVNTWVGSQCGLPATEITLAEIAKQAGYKTGYLGKWHLGVHKQRYGDNEHHPLNQGFDHFYGLIGTNLDDFGTRGDRVAVKFRPWFMWQIFVIWAVTAISVWRLYTEKYIRFRTACIAVILWAMPCYLTYWQYNNLRFLNSMLFRQYDVVEQPIELNRLSRKLVREGLEFLSNATSTGQPYFLVAAYSHMHTYLETGPEFSDRSPHGIYGDALEELDWSVGQFLDFIDKNGQKENTLVYFTSDNGGHLELGHEGGYNGKLKGGKTHGAIDGGIRVPGIIRWPGKVPSGSSTDEPTTLMDFYNLLSTATGVPLPSDRQLDGKDILPLLQGETTTSPHEYIYHYCGSTVHGVRYRPRTGAVTWKLLHYNPDYLGDTKQCRFVCTCSSFKRLDPPYLYDMTNDPGETSPIDPDSKTYQEILPRILAATQTHVDSLEKVESQFTPAKLLWRPSLQPCCNGVFPLTCDCRDNKYIDIV